MLPTVRSGATVFQVKDIPDCRYAAEPTFPSAKRTVCAQRANVVIDPNDQAVGINAITGALATSFPVAALRLNVTPLLPDDVVLAFNASGLRQDGLPPLLISRHYRAQPRTNYVFESLFVLPQPNVRYVNTLLSEFDVPALEGTSSKPGLHAEHREPDLMGHHRPTCPNCSSARQERAAAAPSATATRSPTSVAAASAATMRSMSLAAV